MGDKLAWTNSLWSQPMLERVRCCFERHFVMTKKVFTIGCGDEWEIFEKLFKDEDDDLVLSIKRVWFQLRGFELPSLKRRIPEAHLRQDYKRVKDGVISGSNVFTKAIRSSEVDPVTMAANVKELEDTLDSFQGSKKELALKIAGQQSPLNAAKVLMRIDQFAAKSIQSYGSEVALYGWICERAGLTSFPVSVEALRSFAAILKAAQYRSANCYLSAVMSCDKALGNVPSPELAIERSAVSSSVNRGLGDDFHVLPIGPKILSMVASHSHLMGRDFQFFRLVFDLSVIAMFFMLRSDEVLSIRRRHVIEVTSEFVSILISKDKTNSKEKTLMRKLKCVCSLPNSFIFSVCPRCAISRRISCTDVSHLDKNDQSWEISFGTKKKKLNYSGFLGGIRSLLQLLQIDIEDSDGKNLFGTHSFRRGGAQALASAGWPIDLIQRWGRWASDAIYLYVMDQSFENTWSFVADSIIGESKVIPNPVGLSVSTISDPEQFASKIPSIGDKLAVFIQIKKVWVSILIILDSGSSDIEAYSQYLNKWPLGVQVFFIQLLPIEEAPQFRVVDLKEFTQWFFL